MAKKKNSRQKHQKEACEDDTSDEELKSYQNVAKACPHVAKAVNLSRLKKALKGITDVEKCKDCKDNVNVPIEDNQGKEDGTREIWQCLQCGYCGCSQSTSEKHAYQHYKTPRSDCHALVLGTSSVSVWCYICDCTVLVETSRSLRDCIEAVEKSKTKKVPNHVMVNGTDKGLSSKHVPVPTSTDAKAVKDAPVAKLKESSKDSQKGASSSKKSISNSVRTIKGLRNLGNTCFFNAVLQNLCQTPILLHELEQRSDKSYIWQIISDNDKLPVFDSEQCHNFQYPRKVPLPDCLPLTQSLLSMLKSMNKPTQLNKTEVLNPSSLFDQICKKSPQFRGFHQQDAHELLRHLLDGIRNEEIKRQKKAILRAFNLVEKFSIEDVNEETKQLIKAYGTFASHTIVEKIFGGQLLSTVVCEECKVSSQVFEPFMDLSLPLAEEKPTRVGKSQKSTQEDFGPYGVTKKKSEETPTLSKHQERKLKQQAKKNAKKQHKMAKLIKVDQDAGSSAGTSEASRCESEFVNSDKYDHDQKSVDSDGDETRHSDNDPEKQNKIDQDGKLDSNEEISDADIEDNDDSENFSLHRHYIKADDQGECFSNTSDKDSKCEKKDCTSCLGDNIEELCNQITDIRIRRDSDKQDDLLDSIDEHALSGDRKQQRPPRAPTLQDIPDETWSHSQSEQQTKEWMKLSLTPLKPRYQTSVLECSVNSCLNQFTASELLTGNNKFRCENCTNRKREATGNSSEVVYSNANKQLLILSPPAVLTLHLKRFQQTGMSLRKLNSFVEFPQILDLAPYCSSICLRLPHMAGVKDEVLYSLYGIVQHSGRLTSGHYTAYIRMQDNQYNPTFLNCCPMGQNDLEQLLEKFSNIKSGADSSCSSIDGTGHRWYYVSDGFFKEVSESEVLRCQAYILFYQRIK